MAESERGAGRERQRPVPPKHSPRSARPWERAEYQRIWLRVTSRDWRTLAVVPGEDGMSTLDVAQLITALGASHGESIGVFDFRDVRMSRALEVIREAEQQLERGERLIFATRSIRENVATIPLARATDGAVLCVSLGSTSMRFAEETIEQIGKDRFLGSLLVRAPNVEAPARPVTSLQNRLEARC
jgi:hypothetical protein